ncbi:uncharacterized protein Z519_07658 [Cladophialophora bantiana CBS 173.52]|uniref:Zn(2)-C6 fungal-type domain-containing protein n=1 Tax=Cladophialophora bantiana (strain ATCC 10958 / CBS 173.52 / CDC B-1940 / NIH 8579) TaxID=1442370 RepID=A0A0D2HLN0_CLAB1|nr:uncharacterized protein Z519_07658 [Cladophialophora bantiana CBS 173.52]KIW91690.1 hypothetical protein Z519_07658 [Cladophialophora bantiana CBS 173.52]
MQSPLHGSNEPAIKPKVGSQRGAATRRKITVIACNTCRSRRTRCGGQRPVCAFCRARGLDCRYEKAPTPPPSSVDLELAAINRRLDYMTTLLDSSTHYPRFTADGWVHQNEISDEEKSPFELLGTQTVMNILGLDANFARRIRQLERATLNTTAVSSGRLYMVTHQQALTALASFSTHIHIWYPIFRPGFSDQYFRVISGPLVPSPASCLTLLVTAIGLVVYNSPGVDGFQAEPTHHPYFEAAIASLPLVLTDDSIESVQSLILLSIYYCCLSKPCHALDYCLTASLKVQSSLRNVDHDDNESYERLRRAYWVILLLESELRVQFNVPNSGIWSLDDEIPLPDSRRTWHFDVDAGSPAAAPTSPASVVSTSSANTDKVQSYFLAEIVMRRMLHRCNTAIRRTSEGKVVYAPGIALELEMQLEEWYNYLPDLVRFEIGPESDGHGLERTPTNISSSTRCPLSNFLRVQYYCCKISIYWPAIYQAIHDGAENEQLLDHSRRFFDSYIRLVSSIVVAFHECIVNRWTLFASIFMTTMAALKGAATPCLQGTVDVTKLKQCFAMTRTADRRMIEISPSLTLLADTLEQKLAAEYGTPSGLISPILAEN